MLVWEHFTISLIASYILVAALQIDTTTGLQWMVIGVIVGTFIDLDHLLYTLITRKSKGIKIISKKINKPQKLMKEFEPKGKLHYSAVNRILLHALNSFLIFLMTLKYFSDYYLIVGVVLLVHLISDMEPEWFKL